MNFSELATTKQKYISRESIVITKKTEKWCQLPYPGHKKGCPNYMKSKTCPPNVTYIGKFIHQFNLFLLIWAEFDFKKYKELRFEEHPEWSKNQVKCVLYWQASIKKILKNKIKTIKNTSDYLLSCGSGFGNSIKSMEAVGINVFATLKNNNIDFEIKPQNKILLVCLLCKKLNEIRTKSGLLLAEKHEKIVYGGRGAYVEISPEQIQSKNIAIPLKEK